MRVLIVDDHDIFREGLMALFDRKGIFEVIGEACSGKDAIDLTCSLLPEIVIMDINMSDDVDGIEATRMIKNKCPEIKILVLSMYKDNKNIHLALEAGADGFCVKDDAYEYIETAILTMSKEKKYLSPSAEKAVRIVSPDEEDTNINKYCGLTDREKEIFWLIISGHNRHDIAGKLDISPRTVDKHKQKIKKKLTVKTEMEYHAISRSVSGEGVC